MKIKQSIENRNPIPVQLALGSNNYEIPPGGSLNLGDILISPKEAHILPSGLILHLNIEEQ